MLRLRLDDLQDKITNERAVEGSWLQVGNTHNTHNTTHTHTRPKYTYHSLSRTHTTHTHNLAHLMTSSSPVVTNSPRA